MIHAGKLHGPRLFVRAAGESTLPEHPGVAQADYVADSLRENWPLVLSH